MSLIYESCSRSRTLRRLYPICQVSACLAKCLQCVWRLQEAAKPQLEREIEDMMTSTGKWQSVANVPDVSRSARRDLLTGRTFEPDERACQCSPLLELRPDIIHSSQHHHRRACGLLRHFESIDGLEDRRSCKIHLFSRASYVTLRSLSLPHVLNWGSSSSKRVLEA